MPITQATRYFGPENGLPPEGVDSPIEAYARGLAAAKAKAVCLLMQAIDTDIIQYRWHYTEIIENWPDLERVVREAGEAFDRENAELIAVVDAAMKNDPRFRTDREEPLAPEPGEASGVRR